MEGSSEESDFSVYFYYYTQYSVIYVQFSVFYFLGDRVVDYIYFDLYIYYILMEEFLVEYDFLNYFNSVVDIFTYQFFEENFGLVDQFVYIDISNSFDVDIVRYILE